MISTKLVVSNVDKDIEIHLNDLGKIFIQETVDGKEYCPETWFTIDPEDWPGIREFINEQFNMHSALCTKTQR